MYMCVQTRNNGHGEDKDYGTHRVVLCMSTTPAPRAPKASHRLRAHSLARRCNDFSGMAIRCCVIYMYIHICIDIQAVQRFQRHGDQVLRVYVM